jgi:hypothetical protein
MFVGVKRLLTADGINDVAAEVTKGGITVGGVTTGGVTTGGITGGIPVGGTTGGTPVVGTPVGVVTGGTPVVGTTGVVNKFVPLPPVRLVKVGTAAPVVNALARVVAPAVPPAPPNARS